MLDPMRFGPPAYDGSVVEFPVWWVADMPIGSETARHLLWIRALYLRIREVLGEQWIDEIKESSDYRYYHEEMGLFLAHWKKEGTVQELKQRPQELNTETAAEHMRSMLDEFEPTWVDDREFGDYDEDETPKIINKRTEEERMAAKLEVESLYRDLDAFDAARKAAYEPSEAAAGSMSKRRRESAD